MDVKGRTVSLVLGSGGARGMAHIGVIHELTEAGCDIRAISGCSIGALVGGAYAAGKLDEFEAWMRSITAFNMISLMDLTWRSGGLIAGSKVIEGLTRIIGNRDIETLPVAFTAVAANLTLEKEVWIRSGPLPEAIRASISLPMLLTPVVRGDAVLVDGGVLNPVPIAPTFGDATDLTIAVNLGGLPVYPADRKKSKTSSKAGGFSYTQSMKQLSDLLGLPLPSRPASDPGLLDVANRAFDSMQNSIARQKLASYPPDQTIEIPRNACGMLDFDRAAEMIELGRKEARRCLERIARGPADA